jgi:hypothetical protein
MEVVKVVHDAHVSFVYMKRKRRKEQVGREGEAASSANGMHADDSLMIQHTHTTLVGQAL